MRIAGLLTLGPLLIAQAARQPSGIYGKVDFTDYVAKLEKANPSITAAQLDAGFVSLYQDLLANPAISGLTLQVHWDLANPNPPTASNAYAWGYIDDAFTQVAAWNSANPAQPPKTIQFIVTAGFNSPQWVLDQIPSCDGMFQTPAVTPPSNCGKVTFNGYSETGDGPVLPLPWDPVYKSAWQVFLTALASRYGANPAFVSISIAGPTATSAEMILPNDTNTPAQTQFGGIMPNAMWLQLLAFHYAGKSAYLKSDQAFIDEWNAAIDMFGQVFSGVTLVATTGGGLLNFSQNFTIPDGFAADCNNPTMDCAAETAILAHFVDPSVGGTNVKATQTSGMTARSGASENNLGVAGVKRLPQLAPATAQILGGEQFDFPFSLQTVVEGCTAAFPPKASDAPAACSIPASCTTNACVPVACIPQACLALGVTPSSLATYKIFNNVPSADLIPPEQALYNVLNVFFDGTPAATTFGGTVGTAQVNFMQVFYQDVQYAEANVATPAHVLQSNGAIIFISAQSLLNMASQKVLAISVPPLTPVAISTSAQLPNATAGVAYSQMLTASGGTPPYAWTVTSGTLPDGLVLSAQGQISGTPTTPGSSAFTVQVADANAASATLALTIVVQPPPLPSITLYVSPNGNDSWSGTIPDPAPDGSDGPFATIDHARLTVQTLNQAAYSQISVQFRGGTYILPAPEQFTAADSGSAMAPIVYQNYPGETPVFSGGMVLQNWTNVSGNRWTTTLPASTRYFENLYYNGVRRLRPRVGGALGTYFRNVGPIYLDAPGPPALAPDPHCSVYFAGSGWECYDRFRYNPADPIVATWKNLSPPAGNPCGQPAGKSGPAGDIELVNFEQYSVSKLRFSCVDTANQIVYLTGVTATETDHPTSHGFIPNHRYLIENVEDALTLPGQWFLDRSTSPWTLTYLANPGENPNTDTVVVPQLPQLMVASGLAYVTFQGLTFQHDNYTIAAAGYDGASEIIAAVSFQNSQNVIFDSNVIAEIAGSGLEFISCVDKSSKPWCVSLNPAAVNANNVIENSAFYDIGANAIRIGAAGKPSDTNENVAQFITVENSVVEGYGHVFASAIGIAQGQGHDNLYTHNDIYDGYKGAISICYCTNSDVNPPYTNNNIVSFNHVHDLFQGITNDSGSLYFFVGTPSPPQSGTGNRMLNNVVHDVTDASILDSDGYGGDGLYFDDFTGLGDAENNLVYRVSGHAMSFSGPRPGPNESSTVKNNIFAFARLSLLNAYDPYVLGFVPPSPMFFTASNNLFYFDRNSSSSPSFYAQGGCVFAGTDAPFTGFQQWTNNLYWRTDGGFAADKQAFHVQTKTDANDSCAGQNFWTFYSLAGWQGLGEDAGSVVKDPGFNNPAYPADDYSLPNGSPLSGFVVFDPTQAGRSNPVIMPPPVPATFPTKKYDPLKDY